MPETAPRCHILSIDGGGIRGIIPAVILSQVEKRLRVKRPASRLADYVDFIAGTSAGGILTTLYLFPDGPGGRPKFTAAEVLDLYRERGLQFFTRLTKGFHAPLREFFFGSKFGSSPMEGLLEEVFGRATLSELLRPCLITAYDLQSRDAFFFKQHKAAASNGDAAQRRRFDYHLVDVCRATSAAPTYFPVKRVKSLAGERYAWVDGALFANNPSLCAYAEVRNGIPLTIDGTVEWKKPLAEGMSLFSIGTGRKEPPIDSWHVGSWGKAQWIGPVINIMLSGVSQTVDFQLQQMFEAVNAPEKYIRLNPPLGAASSELDQVDAENLAALEDETLRYIDEGEGKKKFDLLVDQLERGYRD
jgi:predicted acylesterase/phospholipase RssA